MAQAGISLLYRSESDATWQVIARNLKNTGQHRWQFPRDKGDRLYFRVEAADETGNTAFAETPTPVVLDTLEPQLIVVGVSASEVRTPARVSPAPQPGTIQQTSAHFEAHPAQPPAAIPQQPQSTLPPAPLPVGASVIIENQ